MDYCEYSLATPFIHSLVSLHNPSAMTRVPADTNTTQTRQPTETTANARRRRTQNQEPKSRRTLSRRYPQPPVPLVVLPYLVRELSEERGRRGVLRDRVRELREFLHLEKHLLACIVCGFLLGNKRADVLDVGVRHGDHCWRAADHDGQECRMDY